MAERQFLEIDVDNFNDRLKALRPCVAFTVANALSGEGNMSIDMTFESMDDFAPDAIARKVEPLRKLLEARERLSHLLTYMDGKDSAEQLRRLCLGSPQQLRSCRDHCRHLASTFSRRRRRRRRRPSARDSRRNHECLLVPVLFVCFPFLFFFFY